MFGGGWHNHLPWREASTEVLTPPKQLRIGSYSFDFLPMDLPLCVIDEYIIKEVWAGE